MRDRSLISPGRAPFHRFVFAGLGSLMEHLLIREARHVRSMNDAGGHKMLRNTSALRQCLKAIDVVDPADAELEAAQAYYSLFPLGPSVNALNG